MEKSMIEKLLGMSSGYVLDFSNRTFREFIADSVQREISDQKYDYASGSKANRLRAFWKVEPNHVVGKLLSDLIKYARESPRDASLNRLPDDCASIAERLLQGAPMQMSNMEPLLFISYARPDLQAVEAVVDLLTDAGLRTWFDKKDLKGGQEWEFVIRQQISDASLVLVCLSTNAVDRKGFFHKEMRYAVGEALKLPKGKVYIMPVRLNNCSIPDDLRQWHAVDLFVPSASYKLLSSIGDAINCGARARSEAVDAFSRAIRAFNAVFPGGD
jgi:hypothetical protein